MAHVVLKDLVKTYGSFKAVNHVSLTVKDGEFVALVGPSGCGKTTTLNLVAGLIPITSGEIAIGDRMVNDLDPKDRDIAMVFQNYALYPQKSVYKNLAFPLQMRKLPREEIDRKVREAAKVLDMTHLLERKPRELSGGQQQRVALGRALVRDPAVFLMDEPLSNLDAKLRVQMRSEIKRFHQDLKATIIYVTHDQLEAVTMADKMAVMNGGFLQQYDSPAQVFAHPKNMFVASFIGSPAMSLIPLRGLDRWRQHGAHRLRRLDPSALARQCPQGAGVDEQEDRARRPPLDDHAAQERGPRRHSGQGLHGRADRRRDVRSGVPVRRHRQYQRAAQRHGRPRRADLARIRPGAHAPVRRRDGNGAGSGLTSPLFPGHTMKISAIKPYAVWVGTRNQLIVKVETDEGVFGWGESGLSGREKAVVGAIEHYREFLIGKDAFAIGRIWQEMYRSQYFEGGRVLQAAISAIDIALHDIKGKALGVPVYQLLGGKQRNTIPTFASTGGATPEATIEMAHKLMDAGWNAIRFFPIGQDNTDIFEPRESIGATAGLLNAARKSLGDSVVLGIDYHHRLSVAETASFCQKLDRGRARFPRGADPRRDAGGL